MARGSAGPVRRAWRRLHAAEQRSVDRQLAKIGPPTASEALAVWERMPRDHRAWARQAANAGTVADAPEHAVVLADLQDQLSQRTSVTMRRWMWLMAAALALFAVADVLLGPVGRSTVTTAAVVVFLVVTPSLQARRYRRQRRRNLDRAAELWPQLADQSAGS